MLGRGRRGGAARHLEQVRQTGWLEPAVLAAEVAVDCCCSECSCCVPVAAHMAATLHYADS